MAARTFFKLGWLIAVFAVMASACVASATTTPLVESTELRPIQDDRIDFSLVRNDVDCSPGWLAGGEPIEIVSAHFVVDGHLGKSCIGPVNTALVDAWKLLVEITAPELLRSITVFSAFTDVGGVPADRILAYSRPIRIGSQFSINVEHAFNDKDFLVATLAHQIAHSFTRHQAEITFGLNGEPCPTLELTGICWNAGSKVYRWSEEFWEQEWLDEIQGRPNDGRSNAGDIRRCERHAGFWSAFAAVNPEEDFAESYAFFVLDIEVNNTELKAKNEWFAQIPAAVASRERARAWGHGGLERHKGRCS